MPNATVQSEWEPVESEWEPVSQPLTVGSAIEGAMDLYGRYQLGANPPTAADITQSPETEAAYERLTQPMRDAQVNRMIQYLAEQEDARMARPESVRHASLPEWMKGIEEQVEPPIEEQRRLEPSIWQEVLQPKGVEDKLSSDTMIIKFDEIRPEYRAWYIRRAYEIAKESGDEKNKSYVSKLGTGAVRGAKSVLVNVSDAIGDIVGSDTRTPEEISFYRDLSGALALGDSIVANETGIRKAGIQASQMLPELWPGLKLGRVAAGFGKTVRAAKALFAGTQGAYWTAQIFPDEYETLRASGVPREKALPIALTSAVVQAGIENLKLDPFKTNAAARGILQRSWEYFKNFAGEVTEEGLQAAVSEIASGIATDGVSGKKVATEALKAMKESAGPLAILMGGAGAKAAGLGAIESTQDKLKSLTKTMTDLQFASNEKYEALTAVMRRPTRAVFDALRQRGVFGQNAYTRAAQRKELAEEIKSDLHNELAELGYTPEQIAETDPVKAFEIVDEATRPEQQVAPPDDALIPTENGEPLITASTLADQMATEDLQKQNGPQAQYDPENPYHLSLRRRYFEITNSMFGHDPIASPERRGWAEALAEARRRDLANIESATDLANDILHKPRPMDDIETAGMVSALAEVVFEHKQQLEKAAEINEGRGDAGQLPGIRRRLAELEARHLMIRDASLRSGTEKGRALAAQKITLDRNMDLVSVLSRAAGTKGDTLTTAERAQMEKLVKERDEAVAKADKLEQQLAEGATKDVLSSKSPQKRRVSSSNRNRSLPQMYARINELMEAGC